MTDERRQEILRSLAQGRAARLARREAGLPMFELTPQQLRSSSQAAMRLAGAGAERRGSEQAAPHDAP